jgi:accessory gene regulator protein AgrB
MWQRIGKHLKWWHMRRNVEGHNIEDKIHCTVPNLDETFFEIFFSHL